MSCQCKLKAQEFPTGNHNYLEWHRISHTVHYVQLKDKLVRLWCREGHIIGMIWVHLFLNKKECYKSKQSYSACSPLLYYETFLFWRKWSLPGSTMSSFSKCFVVYENHVNEILWPSQLPDLSPIKTELLGRHVKQCSPPQSLKHQLRVEWYSETRCFEVVAQQLTKMLDVLFFLLWFVTCLLVLQCHYVLLYTVSIKEGPLRFSLSELFLHENDYTLV